MSFTPKKYKITVLAASWDSPELLEVFIPTILSSFTEDNKLCIALNQADHKSLRICSYYREWYKNFEFIALNENYGHLAIDFFAPNLNSEYIMNTNDDMFFVKGWDTALIELIEKSPYIKSVSPFSIEPRGTGNPAVIVDGLGGFDMNTYDLFKTNVSKGKYSLPNYLRSHNHPIMCRTSDFYQVGCYSDRFDLNWWYGGGLDDWFAYRLLSLNQTNNVCLVSKDICVYHAISMTQRKQTTENQKKSNEDYFIKKTGINIAQFMYVTHRYAPISIL